MLRWTAWSRPKTRPCSAPWSLLVTSGSSPATPALPITTPSASRKEREVEGERYREREREGIVKGRGMEGERDGGGGGGGGGGSSTDIKFIFSIVVNQCTSPCMYPKLMCITE